MTLQVRVGRSELSSSFRLLEIIHRSKQRENKKQQQGKTEKINFFSLCANDLLRSCALQSYTTTRTNLH